MRLITRSSSVEGQNRRLCCKKKKSNFNLLALPISACCCLPQPPRPQPIPPAPARYHLEAVCSRRLLAERLATVIIKPPRRPAPLAFGAGKHLGHRFDLGGSRAARGGLTKGSAAGGMGRILPVPSASRLEVPWGTSACLAAARDWGAQVTAAPRVRSSLDAAPRR